MGLPFFEPAQERLKWHHECWSAWIIATWPFCCITAIIITYWTCCSSFFELIGVVSQSRDTVMPVRATRVVRRTAHCHCWHGMAFMDKSGAQWSSCLLCASSGALLKCLYWSCWTKATLTDFERRLVTQIVSHRRHFSQSSSCLWFPQILGECPHSGAVIGRKGRCPERVKKSGLYSTAEHC